MKLGDKVMRLPETFTDSGEDKRSLRRPVVGGGATGPPTR